MVKICRKTEKVLMESLKRGGDDSIHAGIKYIS